MRLRRLVVAVFLLMLCGTAVRAEEPAAAPPAEEEFLIVKYGSITIKAAQPEAKVYIDETYKGLANTVIENVVAGEHVVSCVLEDKTVTGTFVIKKNETLKLEARFNEGKMVSIAEQESAVAKKKKEQEAAAKKQEKKKPEEPKKVEKSPADERKDLHLNIFKLVFTNRENQEVTVTAHANPKVISGYAESKGQTGKYYRTKSGLLLCEAGPCVQEWTSKFFYTDENGKRDAFMITWKQTVFSGMTPSGTSSREFTWCLSGECRKMTAADTAKAPDSQNMGTYTTTWSKETAVIRRADIVKEILDAGGTLPE